jgi:hypothetical protein
METAGKVMKLTLGFTLGAKFSQWSSIRYSKMKGLDSPTVLIIIGNQQQEKSRKNRTTRGSDDPDS